jgi:tetratricopeptide (TPR) repeat protein
VLAIGFCLQSASVHAADAGIEWDTLNREVMDLGRAGHYDRAIIVAKKALEVAEHNVGPHHPDVATSLSGLAELYREKGDYAAAEPLHKRALAIFEQTLGPTHPAVATSLNNLAALYRAMQRDAEATLLEQRAAAIQAMRR